MSTINIGAVVLETRSTSVIYFVVTTCGLGSLRADNFNSVVFLTWTLLHPYLKEAVMERETVVEGRTQLEEVAHLLEKTVTPPAPPP